MARSDSPDESIDKYLANVDIAYQFVSKPSFDDTQLNFGAVFWFARWSGPSVGSMKKLAQLLSEVELSDSFLFRILDIDDLQGYYSHYNQYDITIGGNGECFWYMDGSVISATSGFDYEDGSKASDVIRKNFSL